MMVTMRPLVFTRDGDVVPPVLHRAPVIRLPSAPGRGEIDPHLPPAGPEAPRLVVVGDDALLAAVLTRLMRTERLDLEIAYVAPTATAATANYRLPHGEDAATLALVGVAREVPLIRDDTGAAVVGSATITGPGHEDLEGEAYADEERVFTGTITGCEIRPTPEPPGLRAAVIVHGRHWYGARRTPTWFPGRAVQFGMVEGILIRDGIPHRRSLKRSTFYRHVDPWRLVLPDDTVHSGDTVLPDDTVPAP